MKATPLLLAVALAAAGCSGGARPEPVRPTPQPAPEPSAQPAAAAVDPEMLEAAARADSLRDSFTQADVDFVTHMLHHHAQALVMAQMSPTHGASGPIRVLSGRIINAQRDEIALMSRWLRDRGQPVPDLEHGMHGGEHMDMPGMLTPEQLARLDEAQDAEFDRLFLTFMIQHHEGAVEMVAELFNTYGAVQGDALFKIASDINVDQSTEIERMRLMLRDMVLATEGQ